MNRKQNVIVFSAGESVRNGSIEHITTTLTKRGINCYDYRSLFQGAHHAEQIALLPNLLKKIPTFDFALIFAEGVDTLWLRETQNELSMRDNVIFELGLCTMALGVERVILLAEEHVRIPEDLLGVGKMGVECVTFASSSKDDSISKVGEIITKKAEYFSEKFTTQLDEIIRHINVNSEVISPVFVGAAVSSAEAYFLNFIIRLLENTDKGFAYKNDMSAKFQFPEEFKIRIILPTTVGAMTRDAIDAFYSKNSVEEFVISDAGTRGLFFKAVFDKEAQTLTVIDIPTSITASYSVVSSVLNIESDDDYDSLAEERFLSKEMDLYFFALNKLLILDLAKERLSFIKDPKKKESILKKLNQVSVEIVDIP